MTRSENSNLLISLVDELRSLDPAFKVFGAEKRQSGWGHGYQFNQVLTSQAIDQFEFEHAVTLPPEYREFLTQVGDGGAGPYYGIKTLAEAAEYSSLAVPFPWSSEITLTTNADYELWEDYPGVLDIAEHGCGNRDILVVNGPAKGQIWSAVDGSLIPSHYNFTHWYMEWVTRCINTIKREPLIDSVCVGMTKQEVQAILGWDMHQWTPESRTGSRTTEDPSYYIGFTNTNASFSMSEDHRVLKINKSDMIF